MFCAFLVMLGFTSRMVVQDALCIHASKLPAYVTHICHLIMHLSKMDGNCFSVPLSFRHWGKNDFSPMLAETLEHLKALLICSPWSPTMVWAVPFSYNQ